MRHSRFFLISVLVPLAALVPFAALVPSAAMGQAIQDSTRAITPTYDPNLSVNLPIQKVGPEDLLSMNVYDSPEFTRTVRVAADGTIRLPMLKVAIPVSGLYPNEIEVKIQNELKEEGLLVDPFVTVNVAEYHSRPVNVSGSVRSPTIFQVIGNVTLMDAIARAQGLNPDAGPDIIVLKPNGPDGAKSVQHIPVKALFAGSDPSLNLKLTGGEEVSVPQVQTLIVEGSVAKPGSYPVLDPISTNTVGTAIAQAGGLIQFADHKAYIIRTDADGTKHTIEVPLWDIINRKVPDVPLQAKDVLEVPDSPKRRITQTTIQALSGFSTSTTTGLIIYRH